MRLLTMAGDDCVKLDSKGALPMLIMLLGCCTQGLLSDCPRLCECKWKSGKEAVSCVNANYSVIPPDLDVGTQLLNLTGNNILRLKQDDFLKAGLLNLQKLYLARCRLKLIDRYAFRRLINLVELDLSENYLYTVPSYILESMPELRELKLNGNPILRITNKAFVNAPKLMRIELSHCMIESIDEKAFEGVEKSLQWLKINSNHLSVIKPATFASIELMYGLELAGNPWNCTCALRPFREWMIQHNIPFEIPPICKFPKRLETKSWKYLDLDEFACMPKIKTPDTKAHGIEGNNVTITCTINAVPKPNIKWLLKNRVIANQTNVSVSSSKKQYVVRIQNNSSNLTIPTADVQDAGVYICSAENKAGKVEASVTLAVSRKPSDDLANSKVVIAGAIIAVIFVCVVTLLIVCVCSVQRRRRVNRWNGRRTPTGRRNEDHYEKIEMTKLSTSNNANVIPAVSVSCDMPGSTRKYDDYHVVPSTDTDQEVDDCDGNDFEYVSMQKSSAHGKNRDTKLWTTGTNARSVCSPNGRWISDFSDSNLDPNDLHIPRRTKEETRDANKKSLDSTFGTYNNQEPNDFISTNISLNIPQTIHSHIMKKQTLSNNGSLYTSIPFSSEMERLVQNDLRQHSGLVEEYEDISGSSNISENNENLYCTLPRQKLNYNKKRTRFLSCDSESPLLPASRYSSSGGDSNTGSRITTRRFSEDSINHSFENNQPLINQKSNSYLTLSSPRHSSNLLNNSCDVAAPDSTPLLNIGALTSKLEHIQENSVPSSSNDRQTDLGVFFEDYLHVKNQLDNMKEICDTLKQKQGFEMSDYQQPNPRSILKKSVTSLNSHSSIFMNNTPHSSSSTISASVDLNDDWSTFLGNHFEGSKRFY